MIGESLSHLNIIIYVVFVTISFGTLSEIFSMLHRVCTDSISKIHTTTRVKVVKHKVKTNTKQPSKNQMNRASIKNKNRTTKKQPKCSVVQSQKVVVDNHTFKKILLMSCSHICDIIVVVGLFYTLFHCINKCNYGEFRWYFVIIILVTFALEKISVGQLFAKSYEMLYNKISKGAQNDKKESQNDCNINNC